MKKEIHPKYVECKVTCGCGNAFVTRSTSATLSVEVCSNCHPFFTGQQKFLDTAGRVEKFQKKYQWNAAQAATKADEAQKKEKAATTKAKRKPPVATTLFDTSTKPKAAAKAAAEGAAAGGPGGRPGGAGGGGGRPGGAGGGGRPGGRGKPGGRKKDAAPSTERLRVGKPKAEEPKTEATQPAAEAPKAEIPKTEETKGGQA